jgi:hypothetical protein
MHWWRYVNAEDGPMGESERFESGEEAEAWLAEAWRLLVGRGVAEVLLYQEEGGEDVFLYRMALGPETSGED